MTYVGKMIRRTQTLAPCAREMRYALKIVVRLRLLRTGRSRFTEYLGLLATPSIVLLQNY